MSTLMSTFATLVEQVADLLQPLFHASAAAAAIILITALVRLLAHPLSRASARGQRARAALRPQVAELREKHGGDPGKYQEALRELHAREKVSPLAGCLPGLLQLPAFVLLYHLFSSATIGGESNGLLSHRLFGAPLGHRYADALGDGGVFGAQGLVYLVLFAVVALVATFNYRRTKRTMAASVPESGGEQQVPGLGAVGAFMPFLSYFTLLTVVMVPLAAALYVVTSTTWSAVERALLHP